ncbi:MAG: hypothetical protein INQ03_19295 [Candidatus Heimdallarchaeota archaeon]|nr:hypothetical protein [Candidatus Heimdallarchaeota archaeon]
MNVDRITLNIDAVDKTIQGLPIAAAIALISDNIGLKREFIKKIIESNPKKTLIINTKESPLFDLINKTSESVIIVDAVSWRYKRINPSLEVPTSVYTVNNLSDLNNLLSKITQAVKNHEDIQRVVLDSASNLLLYSTPGHEQVVRFIELLITFCHSKQINLFFTIHPIIHDPRLVNTLEYISDGCIYLRNEDGEDQIKLKDLLFSECDHHWMQLKM